MPPSCTICDPIPFIADNALVNCRQVSKKDQTSAANAWRLLKVHSPASCSGHTALLEDHINIASLMRKNGFSPPRPVTPSTSHGETPHVEPPANGPSPSDLTDLAARDPVNPGVVAVNPGVSGAANSENPRVRDALGSAAEVPAARVRDAGAKADVSSSDVSGLRYDSPVSRRRRAAVPDEVYDEMGRFLEPWRIVTSPLVSGAENLPDPSAEPRRPILFVGNHTIFGLYDSPLLVHELFMRGFRCRGLAHPGHWRSGAGQLFERCAYLLPQNIGRLRIKIRKCRNDRTGCSPPE